MKELRASLEQLQRQAADERDEMKRLGQAEGLLPTSRSWKRSASRSPRGGRGGGIGGGDEELSAALAAQSTSC